MPFEGLPFSHWLAPAAGQPTNRIILTVAAHGMLMKYVAMIYQLLSVINRKVNLLGWDRLPLG